MQCKSLNGKFRLRFFSTLQDKRKAFFSKYIDRYKRRYQNWRELKERKDDFNKSYIGSRWDILELVNPSYKRVLDVGCSIGRLGEDIKQKTNGEVAGIELNREMSEIASQKLDKVITGDVELINLSDYFEKEYFDCIIFGDILEHLRDPWSVLKNYCEYLRQDGTVILSLPNIRHISTLYSLIIRDYWPYRDRGIHDRTHMRFFTLRNIKELIQGANLVPVKVIRRYRLIERGHIINVLSFLLVLPLIRSFITFSYLIIAKKKDA